MYTVGHDKNVSPYSMCCTLVHCKDWPQSQMCWWYVHTDWYCHHDLSYAGWSNSSRHCIPRRTLRCCKFVDISRRKSGQITRGLSFQLSSQFSTVRMYTAVFVNSLADFVLIVMLQCKLSWATCMGSASLLNSAHFVMECFIELCTCMVVVWLIALAEGFLWTTLK